jgi:hypothetical protein
MAMCPTEDPKYTFCSLLIPLIFGTNAPLTNLHSVSHSVTQSVTLGTRSIEPQPHTRNTASLLECWSACDALSTWTATCQVDITQYNNRHVLIWHYARP